MRRDLLALRAAILPSERAAADAAIGHRLDAVLSRLAPAVVAGYWPMRDEPELIGLFTRWHAAGVGIALPRVVGADQPLVFDRWSPGAPMAHGLFGTRHPASCEPLAPEALLIPCVGFDAGGYRLGYGGGFYDRTLPVMTGVFTIGIAYDECELAGFERAPHDRPLDRIVTQTRVLAPDR
ncbi:MAG: hypothetical protein RIS35_3503 [Pseudomonadota bacterium]|jgi:5,10-methenyltetrahydrofolate synthetase